MTKTNSTADFFLKYLRYKLGKDKLLFFLSVIMGLLSFVHSAAALLIITADGKYTETEYDYWVATSGIALLAGAVILGVVVAAAIMSFNFCLHRHETDMLGSLPVSHRARFWGDLLSGYVLSVVPFSLLSALCIPFVAAAESHMNSTLYTEYFAYVVLTTFFSLTLLYAFAVLAASICGRMASTIACVFILITASMNVVPGAARFFMASIAGMPAREIYYRIQELTPTLDVLSERLLILLLNVPLFSSGHYPLNPETGLMYTVDEHLRGIIDNTAASDFVNIIVWTAEIAVIIAAAFFLTKFRKAERTGGAFGYKYGYYAVLFVAVAVIFLFNSGYLIESYITTVILSGVVFLVFEIAMRHGWKKFWIGAAALVGSLALTMGAAWIVRDTGAFGLRNKLPDADDIVTAYFDDCEFTDREDIEHLRLNHLKFLKNYGNAVETAEGYGYYSHEIKYKLKNGETFTRCYEAMFDGESITTISREKCEEALESLPLGLKDYEKQLLLNFDASKYVDCHILLKDAFGGVILKSGKMREFAEILIGEYTSNDKKGKIIGSVEFYDSDDRYYIRPLRLDIYDSYTKTAEFLRNENNIIIPENDGETLCYSISHMFGQEPHYELNILKKDLENEKVKELISLLTDNSNILHTDISVYSNDLHNGLYVPDANQARFTMLVFEIFAERISDN